VMVLERPKGDSRLSRVFFCNIMDPTSCPHSLLPPPRSTVITSRLRSSQTFAKVYTRTKRYCSFIQHGLNHNQKLLYCCLYLPVNFLSVSQFRNHIMLSPLYLVVYYCSSFYYKDLLFCVYLFSPYTV